MSTLQSNSFTVYHLHTVANMRIASTSALMLSITLQPACTGTARGSAAVKTRHLQQQSVSVEQKPLVYTDQLHE